MSHEYYRRGRNWYTAIGFIFGHGRNCPSQQLLIWGPEFVQDFCLMEKLLMKSLDGNVSIWCFYDSIRI